MPTTTQTEHNAQVPQTPNSDKFTGRLGHSPDEDFNGAESVHLDPMATEILDSTESIGIGNVEISDPLASAGMGDGNYADIRGHLKEDPEQVSIDRSSNYDYGGPTTDRFHQDPGEPETEEAALPPETIEKEKDQPKNRF